MTAIGFVVLFLVFALVVPFVLYWMLDAEDPDPSRATSWDDARQRARNDGPRRGRRDREDDGADESASHHDDRSVEGNHWS